MYQSYFNGCCRLQRPQKNVHAVVLLFGVYFLRFVLIYLGLASRINLRHYDAIRALAGGLALAAVVMVVDWVTGLAIPAHQQGQIAWVSAQIFLMGLACIAMVRMMPTRLFGITLSRQLLDRTSDSRFASVLCSLLGLKPH